MEFPSNQYCYSLPIYNQNQSINIVILLSPTSPTSSPTFGYFQQQMPTVPQYNPYLYNISSLYSNDQTLFLPYQQQNFIFLNQSPIINSPSISPQKQKHTKTKNKHKKTKNRHQKSKNKHHKSKNKSETKKILEFKCTTRDQELQGIINYLTKQCGGNAHENGVINITASTIDGICPAKNAIDFDSNSYYQASTPRNEWIQFDFKEKKVCLSSYTIKARDDANVGSPQHFVIEGSDNGLDWIVLDNQNTTLLTNRNSIHNFEVNQKQSGFYRFLRLRQTGNNIGNGKNNLTITAFEFFGSLKLE